ncbi:hypothetical protein [Undibacterium sp. TJN19]|uniref:hypothetical protein n=1 Tax=Undibacterium sp. TJN19 TaxID=3413055 RepID=UPI003BEF5AFA
MKTTLLKQLIQNLRSNAQGLVSACKAAASHPAKRAIASYPTPQYFDCEMFNDVSPINDHGTWLAYTTQVTRTRIRGETLKVTGAS